MSATLLWSYVFIAAFGLFCAIIVAEDSPARLCYKSGGIYNETKWNGEWRAQCRKR